MQASIRIEANPGRFPLKPARRLRDVPALWQQTSFVAVVALSAGGHSWFHVCLACFGSMPRFFNLRYKWVRSMPITCASSLTLPPT